MPHKDREVRLQYFRDRYKNNPEHKRKTLISNKARKDRILKFIRNEKVLRGCSVCGFNNCASALDFHHKFGKKEFSLAKAHMLGYSIKRIELEISKCIVLCANHHKMEHCKEDH